MRIAAAVNAVLAWIGLALNLGVAAFANQPNLNAKPGLYGSTGGGAASKVFDSLSYFTIWSVIVVAVSTTLLALQPERDTPARRAIRLSGLLMITVTALVYAVLVAPTNPLHGWSYLTNPWVHILVPGVTLLVWLIWGPRRWITWRTVLGALVVPVIWAAYAFARGAVDHLYPYGFMNVTTLGYATSLRNVVIVLGCGLLLAALFKGIDGLPARRRTAD